MCSRVMASASLQVSVLRDPRNTARLLRPATGVAGIHRAWPLLRIRAHLGGGRALLFTQCLVWCRPSRWGRHAARFAGARGSSGSIVHWPTATQRVAVRMGWPCRSGPPSLHRTIHLPACGSWLGAGVAPSHRHRLTLPHPRASAPGQPHSCMSQPLPQLGNLREPLGSVHICRSGLPTRHLHAGHPAREAPPAPPHVPVSTQPSHLPCSVEASPCCSRPFPACLPSQGTHFLGVWISGLSSRLGQDSRWKARGRGAEEAARVFPPHSLP